MKKTLIICTLVGLAAASQANLTLVNGDFEGGVDAAATPNGWTEIAANHAGSFYANVTDASGAGIGVNHNLYMQGRGNGNIIQQSFGGGTADSQGTIELTMDLGWRDDPAVGTTYEYVLEIYNVTDSLTLDSITYAIPPDGLDSAVDPRTIDVAKSFVFTYDNTDPAFAGDEIAFRLTSNSSANSWDPTGFIDNVNVIPEPATLGMVAVFGGGILFIRRKLML